MDAVQTGKPPESETGLTVETAAEHATARVPVADPFQRVGDVRDHLIGQRDESASHIVVCEADTFLGIVTIEKLLLAPADAKMESLMDRFTGHLRGYHDLTESAHLDLGASYAFGHNGSGLAEGIDVSTRLYGIDGTFRWRPLQRSIYRSFIGRSEIVWRAGPALVHRRQVRSLGSRPQRHAPRHRRIVDVDLLAERVQSDSRAAAPHALREDSTATELLFQVMFNIGAPGAHPF